MQPADRILKWYAKNGREDLPWRQSISPYRVWLSEIMLQQTQVKTVIPYFEKFILQFPTINDLASASLEDVLHLWTGLGYYSRAINLHKTSVMIQQQYTGEFPDNLNELIALPGIGRSTAGAILAIAFKKRAVILDGNVKRILSRFFSIKEPLNTSAIQKLLWQHSEEMVPHYQVDDYTQASMDLGALICTRSNPKCDVCPLQQECLAFKNNLQNEIPVVNRKKILPIKKTIFLILQNAEGDILLHKRPAVGIWRNLWSFPECEEGSDIKFICKTNLFMQVKKMIHLESFRHTFSHFHLDIFPVLVKVDSMDHLSDQNHKIWYNLSDKPKIGLPAPIYKLIHQLEGNSL